MMPVGGKPVLEHIVSNISDQGFTDIIINLHHLPEVITSHFKNGADFGVSIKYSYEKILLGTAGAVKKMEAEFDESFIVVYGDNMCDFDFSGLLDFHRTKRSQATIVFITGTDPMSGGIADIDHNDKVLRFVEKPEENEISSPWVNGGIYVLEPAILKYIPADRFFDFGKDLFPYLIGGKGDIYGYRSDAALRGINTPEEYSKAKALFEGDN